MKEYQGLYREDVITQEELQEAKRRILGQPKGGEEHENKG